VGLVIQRAAAALAVAGTLAIAGGVALMHPAAGLITFGVEALCGAYVIGYLGRVRR